MQYRINTPKAVVGVDWSNLCIYNYTGNIVEVPIDVILPKRILAPDTFVYMFYMSTLYRLSIELIQQKLW